MENIKIFTLVIFFALVQNINFTLASEGNCNALEEKADEITIYPIPATDFINISLIYAQEVGIEIIYISGQVVYSNTFYNTVNGQVEQINIQDLEDGIHIIKFTSDNEIFTKKMIKITPNDTEEVLKNEITFYPNPATDILNIQLPNSQKVNIKIINAFGSVMYYKLLNNTTNKQNEQINIQDLESGLYILEITSDNTIIRQKLIKKL